MTPETAAQLRLIKPVHEWMKRAELQCAIVLLGYETAKSLVQDLLDECRHDLRTHGGIWSESSFFHKLNRRLQSKQELPLKRVINATGILIHTGLGRSPLSPKAIDAINEASRGYCNLEFDLATGKRGRRADLITGLIRDLTGAQSATVVNNNAAATILALRALAKDKEVIVSRGQLVEIGGAFRLPEIMAVSGAILKEVGTTNKTRLSDYQQAVNEKTAAILRVHTSNYEVVGFTEQPEAEELARLSRENGLWFIDDIGSGALTADALPGERIEPTVTHSVAIGSDLVLFSGDKLLGGPQCGIIVGTQRAVEQLEKDPLMRAFRVGKLTLAALGATLQSWSSDEKRNRDIPLWTSMTTDIETIRARADQLASRLLGLGWNAFVAESSAFAGGGSLPNEQIKSYAVCVSAPWHGTIVHENQLAERLRTGTPAVVGRLHDGAFWIDLRSVQPHEIDELTTRFQV